MEAIIEIREEAELILVSGQLILWLVKTIFFLYSVIVFFRLVEVMF